MSPWCSKGFLAFAPAFREAASTSWEFPRGIGVSWFFTVGTWRLPWVPTKEVTQDGADPAGKTKPVI